MRATHKAKALRDRMTMSSEAVSANDIRNDIRDSLRELQILQEQTLPTPQLWQQPKSLKQTPPHPL